MSKILAILALVAFSAIATSAQASPELTAKMMEVSKRCVAMGANCAGDCAIPAGQTICQMSPEYTKKITMEMLQESPEMQKMEDQIGGKNAALAIKCAFMQDKATCEAEKGCKFGQEGAPGCQVTAEGMINNMVNKDSGSGDMCKGIDIYAEISLHSPDGEPTEAAVAKVMQDKDFGAAFTAINTQSKNCAEDSYCGIGGYCIKAGEDCEPDFIPFLKSRKCGSSIIAKVAKAMARSKAADLVEAKAEVATAKVAVTKAKAEKEAADAVLVKCGDTCSQAETTAAETAKNVYVAAQQTETAAAAKSMNKAASAANGEEAAATADAESGAAQVAVGAAAVVGVLAAQLF